MLTKHIFSQHRSPSFSHPERCYLLALTIIGAIIRLLYQYNRPFVGDEVGTLLYMNQSISYLLSHFDTWLTMNYFILLEKFMAYLGGNNQESLCFIPLLAAIVTIPLAAVLARMITSTRVALIAATLLTMNPYLIYYSGIIRAYSLLTALSLLVMILFFRWYAHRTLRNGVYLALACYFLMLSHLNGAYTVCYVFLITGMDWISTFTKRKRSSITTLFFPLSISLLLVAVSYAQIYPAMSIFVVRTFYDVSPTSIAYLPYVFSSYFVDGYYGWLSAILLISSFFIIYKYDLPLLLLCPYIVLPVILISIQGISHFPWVYGRFLIFLLPVCIMFIAEAIDFYASLMAHRRKLVTLILVILLLITWVPHVRNVFSEQYDYPWRQVADFLKTTYQENDVILYGAWTISHNLYPYFVEPHYVTSHLPRYSEQQYAGKNNGKTFLIVSKPLVTSDYPGYVFGNIQVIIYGQNPYPQLLFKIRDDLLNSIKPGEISPELTDHYRNIWELSKKLHQENDNFKYYQLYVLCLRLTERQRNIPKSLQYSESEAIAKQLFQNN
jgi:hypothetical protein